MENCDKILCNVCNKYHKSTRTLMIHTLRFHQNLIQSKKESENNQGRKSI